MSMLIVTYFCGSLGSFFFFAPFFAIVFGFLAALPFDESPSGSGDGCLKVFCMKKTRNIKNCRKGRTPRGRFQFKRATAAKMPINHNQRNKFSLVSLHVCNINFFREHFYALEFFIFALQMETWTSRVGRDEEKKSLKIENKKFFELINYSRERASLLTKSIANCNPQDSRP